MKRWLLLILCALLFTGCAAEDVFETVADEAVQSVSAELREVILELPPEAAAPASESEWGTLYQCDGYEIALQTMAAGDLDDTIRSISGYGRDNVTMIQTNTGDWKRYEFVWACAGEQGDLLGRAVILDDGSYHYVLSTLADAARTEALAEALDAMYASLSLG